MDTTHLGPFLDAKPRRDPAGLAAHLSPDVALRSPLLADPVRGKAAVGRLLNVLLRVADSFEVTGLVAAETHAAVFVTITAGDVTVEGVDDMHVDHDGLVSSMTIQWRPLASIVAMQQRLAPALGAAALTLIAASEQLLPAG